MPNVISTRQSVGIDPPFQFLCPDLVIQEINPQTQSLTALDYYSKKLMIVMILTVVFLKMIKLVKTTK